jgi:hypothetical protein
MIDPKKIETILKGATYSVPLYKVENTGLVSAKTVEVHFCKGNKEDESVFRQEGFFTETLLCLSKEYLLDNNTGQLESQDTHDAIAHIQKALNCLEERANKRRAAGVQGTYRHTPVEKGAGDDYPVIAKGEPEVPETE